MTQFTLSEGIVFGLGNPLLDISCTVEPQLLKKYGLFANDAILAKEKHKDLCEEIIKKYKVEYTPGGAVLNSLRVMQWFFDQKKLTTFMGAIGDDDFGKQMQTKANNDGVNTILMIEKNAKSGTCACLITGKFRSLCAFPGASQLFKIQHLLDNYQYVEKARVIYTSGYHLAVSKDSILNLAKHVNENKGKVFCLNLSSTSIMEHYSNQLMEVYPYIDILFGNDTEARQFCQMMDWPTFELKQIVGNMADAKSDLKKTGRKVIITHGKEKVFCATTSDPNIKEYNVTHLEDNQVVDTNGAGDAFVGGFFAQYIQNESIDICIKSGIYAATEIIQQSGCVFPKENKFKK